MGSFHVGNDTEGYTDMTYLIDKLLDVVFWLCEAVIGLLPNYTWEHSDAINLLANVIYTIDKYFPVDTLFQIIGIYVGYYAIVTWVRPLLKFVRLA